MLAAAEADLEPDLVHLAPEQAGGIGEVLRGVEPQARQQRPEQVGLPGAQLLALAPAEEGAGAACAIVVQAGSAGFSADAERSSSTRSVFSQVKPPSASGARPKWP